VIEELIQLARDMRAAEALSYDALVQSFPEITRFAHEGGQPASEQATLFGADLA
jgi:putative DNA methylase